MIVTHSENCQGLTLKTTMRPVELTVSIELTASVELIASEVADAADIAAAAGLTLHSELEQGGTATTGCDSKLDAECTSSSRQRPYWQRRTGGCGVRESAHMGICMANQQCAMCYTQQQIVYQRAAAVLECADEEPVPTSCALRLLRRLTCLQLATNSRLCNIYSELGNAHIAVFVQDSSKCLSADCLTLSL